MGIVRVPEVRATDASLGPAILHGLTRPTLFLSRDAFTQSADAIDAVLAHELAHHRGRDRYSMLAVAVVRSIWWFHPAVKWATTRWSHGLELVRDADAIRTLGADSRVGYARLLLDAAAEPGRAQGLGVLSLGWESAVGHAEERVRRAALPAGVSAGARWVGAFAVSGLVAAAVATAASTMQEPSVPSEASEGSVAGDFDLERRLAKLEFDAASELAAVEQIATRYGLTLILEPGFHLYKLDAEGTNISAREALDFIVRDYSGGVWREEHPGVIRISVAAAEEGTIRTREYDFTSVMEEALGKLRRLESPGISEEEALEKLRKALLGTAEKVLRHTYPDDHQELAIQGATMRVTAGLRCQEAMASLLRGLRSPTLLSIPELSMRLDNSYLATPNDSATVASLLDGVAAKTGYLIATTGLDHRQLMREIALANQRPTTVLYALEQIGRVTGGAFHVGARSLVLSQVEAPTVRVYAAGAQPLFGGFQVHAMGSSLGYNVKLRSGGALIGHGADFSMGSSLATGVAGHVVIACQGLGGAAEMLAIFARTAGN